MTSGVTIPIDAPQRRGKSLLMTKLALDAHEEGRRVYSTIWFGFPHTRLQFRDLRLATEAAKDDPDASPFNDAHVAIDEWNFYCDSRNSGSRLNKQFTYFLLQQKKLGCNVTGTTHAMRYLDVRIRENYDYRFAPVVYPAFPERPELLAYRVHSGPTQTYRQSYRRFIEVEDLLGLYNTRETYDPFEGMVAEPPAPRAKKADYTGRVNL